MGKIIIFAMTKKGFLALNYIFRNKDYKSLIKCVVSCEEKGVIKDYYNDIAELCYREGISFYHKSEFDEKIIEDTDFLIAIGWKWIIKSKSKNLFVLHDSLLPRYRGFIPLVNMLINGEEYIGVTMIKANEFFDKGDIIGQKKIKIKYPIKINEAVEMIAPLYAELLEELFLKILRQEKIEGIPQNESESTYSVWRDELDYFIDWHLDSSKILRFIHAVGFPYKGAAAYIGSQLVRILDAEEYQELKIEDRDKQVGKVLFFDQGHPVVICGRGMLKLTEIVDDKTRERVFLKSVRVRFTPYKCPGEE